MVDTAKRGKRLPAMRGDPKSFVETLCRPITCKALAALVCLTSALAPAQDSQFLFDDNGNLLVQTGGTSGPPQILAQPQNQVVEPGESASFSVVVADTRGLSYQWRF